MSVMLLRQLDKRIDRVQTKLARMTGEDIQNELNAVSVALAALPTDSSADGVRKVLERQEKSLEKKKKSKTSTKGKAQLEKELELLTELREFVSGHPDYKAGKRGRPKKS